MSSKLYGSGLRKGTQERLQFAVSQDRSIIAREGHVAEHAGNTEEYLCMIGMEPQDLKRLERYGFAVRAYRPDGSGWRKRWIIVAPNMESGNGQVQSSEGDAQRVPTEGQPEG